MNSIDQFRSMLVDAEFVDDRYDATGSFVWLPYGLKLRERTFSLLSDRFETEGYDRYGFPLLLPESYLRRQEDAVTSFEDGVCWVDRFGTDDLDESYYLRPTGEAQIYPMVERWLRSYRDLPLKMLLMEPMFRAFRGGTPLLAAQGSTLVEGHGFFPDRASAEEEVAAAVDYVDTALVAVGLEHTLSVERPLWGNLPVSERNIGFDAVTPIGRTFLAASLYLQGDIYSEPYELQYRDEDNELQLVTTIDWGLSTRVLGLSLLNLADDRGFRVLPDLSPVQVVFVSITNSPDEIEYAETLAEALPFRTEIDGDEDSLGKRFERWEQKGVPVRVEIGPDEVNGDHVTVFRRDTNDRSRIDTDSTDSFRSSVDDLLEDIAVTLRKIAESRAKEAIRPVEEVRSIACVVDDGDVAQFNYCGSEDCGRTIEAATNGEILGSDLERTREGHCINCDSSTDRIAYASRRF